MKKILSALMFSLILNAQNNIEKPQPPVDITQQLIEWKDEFANKMHIHYGENNGKYFGYTQEVVSLRASDPQFVDALVNAYDKAYLKAQQEYAMDLFGNIITKQLRESFKNQSTNAKEIEFTNYKQPGFWTKISLLLDKMTAVADKKLDNLLIKLGVSEEELSKMTPKEKKVYFKDKFIKNTIKKAAGSVNGMFIIQSAWSIDNNGNALVGLITVVSPKTKQIAKDIMLNRETLIKGKKRNIDEIIPKSSKTLSQMWGVRLSYDKDGKPVIISYGISGYKKSKDFYTNQSLKEDAFDDAMSNADSQIALVVNGYLNSKVERKRGELIEKYVEREIKPNSATLDKQIKNIIKKAYEMTKADAKMQLQGISTYRKWSYTLPTGVEMVGVVRVWKYSTLNAVNKFKHNINNYHNQNKTSKKINVSPNFNESPIQNDINDF